MASDLGHRQRDGAVRLVKAPWYDVPTYWPEIEQRVAAALARGSLIYLPEDIRAALLSREMQLWLAIAIEDGSIVACAVAKLETYRRAKICHVLIIAGEGIDNWIHFHKAVEAWAAGQGYRVVEGWGRRGWQRVMKARGYEPVFVVYRKILGES